MKKFLLLAALVMGSTTAFATEQLLNDSNMLHAQYNSNEQVVRAYYLYNGQLATIQIK